ncbi:MAG: tRNA pseudouridine(38-40) synthase TruA [Candidatus Dormiibacterota bacterium]
MVTSAAATYRMVLAYDGTRYRGWQVQPKVATVQGEFSRALAELTQENPVIRSAGRTDAGAHAHGQVISFSLQSVWAPGALKGGCNAHLPEDIGVLEATLVGSDFHPRWQAWRRTYRYLVRDAAAPDPVGRQYEWRIPRAVELAPMRSAARLLLGTHDFAGFGTSPFPSGSSTRTVDRSEIARHDGVLTLEVRADAFLRGMMRNFAGALVAVGTGRASASDLAQALLQPGRLSASWETAPAHGLHQWQVDYRASAAEVQA